MGGLYFGAVIQTFHMTTLSIQTLRLALLRGGCRGGRQEASEHRACATWVNMLLCARSKVTDLFLWLRFFFFALPHRKKITLGCTNPYNVRGVAFALVFFIFWKDPKKLRSGGGWCRWQLRVGTRQSAIVKPYPLSPPSPGVMLR